MSPTSKPSAVPAIRRGLEAAQAEPSAPAGPPVALPAAERLPRPPKDVRFTLDLTEDRHAFLKRFAEESGAGVRASQVMRALLDELADSPDLAKRVRVRIQAAKR